MSSLVSWLALTNLRSSELRSPAKGETTIEIGNKKNAIEIERGKIMTDAELK